MKNPKTTWGGILFIVAGVTNFVAQVLTGHPVDINMLTALAGAVTGGLALINATDGTA